jgi:hypothetical protein
MLKTKDKLASFGTFSFVHFVCGGNRLPASPGSVNRVADPSKWLGMACSPGVVLGALPEGLAGQGYPAHGFTTGTWTLTKSLVLRETTVRS